MPGRDPARVAANGPSSSLARRRRRSATDDLYAARVDPDGTVAHPGGFEVAPSASLAPSWSLATSIAPGAAGGTFSVSYARYLPEQPYGASRIVNRTVNPK